MKKLFLLDAYALIYRSYYALIRSPRINSKGMNTSAVMGFVNTLNEVITKERPDYLGVAFDHGKTFRHEAYEQYKARAVAQILRRLGLEVNGTTGRGDRVYGRQKRFVVPDSFYDDTDGYLK